MVKLKHIPVILFQTFLSLHVEYEWVKNKTQKNFYECLIVLAASLLIMGLIL